MTREPEAKANSKCDPISRMRVTSGERFYPSQEAAGHSRPIEGRLGPRRHADPPALVFSKSVRSYTVRGHGP